MRLMKYFIGYMAVMLLQQGTMPKTFIVDQLLHVYLGVLGIDFLVNHFILQRR